jgi:hypothetical protein
MNTAMGNVVIMSLLFYQLLTGLGVAFEFYDDGDDSVLIVEQADVQQLQDAVPAFFLRHGFTMKMSAPRTVFEQVEFCQTQPVFDGERWTMVRDPRTAIAKDSCSTLPCEQTGVLQMWLRAVSDCGEAISGGIPVWDEFYRRYRQLSGAARPGEFPELETGMARLARGMRRRFREPSPQARVSFFNAFGVEPFHQVLMEKHYRQLIVDLSVVKQGCGPLDREYLRGCHGLVVC